MRRRILGGTDNSSPLDFDCGRLGNYSGTGFGNYSAEKIQYQPVDLCAVCCRRHGRDKQGPAGRAVFDGAAICVII